MHHFIWEWGTESKLIITKWEHMLKYSEEQFIWKNKCGSFHPGRSRGVHQEKTPWDIDMSAEFGGFAQIKPIRIEFTSMHSKQGEVTFVITEMIRSSWCFQQNANKRDKFDTWSEGERWDGQLGRNESIMGYVSSKYFEFHPERECLPFYL